MVGILQLACVASFWVKVPVLLAIRVRSGAPWWFVIMAATALGWILSNATVYLQHLVVHDTRRQAAACYTKSLPPPVVIANEFAETAVPCGIRNDWLESYKPLAGLVYGPLYLLCCSLPYWLIVGRQSSCGWTQPIALLAAAALLIEWTAIVGVCIRRGYLDEMLMDADPFIWPPVTIAAACLISWVVTTQVLQRFRQGG